MHFLTFYWVISVFLSLFLSLLAPISLHLPRIHRVLSAAELPPHLLSPGREAARGLHQDGEYIPPLHYHYSTTTTASTRRTSDVDSPRVQDSVVPTQCFRALSSCISKGEMRGPRRVSLDSPLTWPELAERGRGGFFTLFLFFFSAQPHCLSRRLALLFPSR